jgi:hypothetical protein
MLLKILICLIQFSCIFALKIKGKFFFKENIIEEVDILPNVAHCTKYPALMFNFKNKMTTGYLLEGSNIEKKNYLILNVLKLK